MGRDDGWYVWFLGMALVIGLFALTATFVIAHDEPVRKQQCERVTGGWMCTFPTSGLPARVFVQAYEDGSARVVAIDPDK